MKKQWLRTGIGLLLAAAMVGCGSKPSEQGATSTPSPEPTVEATVTATATPTPSPVPEEVVYEPKADRFTNLVLSGEADKYQYTPEEETEPYDINFTLKTEAEDGTFFGEVTAENATSGFSGSGYAVIRDSQTGDQVSMTVTIPAGGFYELDFVIAAPNGDKGNDVLIDGVSAGEVFTPNNAEFATYTVTGIYLGRGEHTISLKASWGWVFLDSCTVRGCEQPETKEKEFYTAQLTDKYASLRTKMLYQFICDIDGLYTLSGQYAQLSTGSNEFKTILDASGRVPAIVGLDLIEHSPSRLANGSKPQNIIQKAINFYEDGGIVTMSWHWNAPAMFLRPNANWYDGFRTEAVNMDLERIVNGVDQKGYEALINDIDVIAFQLKRLQEADVPILWRPLHEASGGWFWWGDEGPIPFKKLWRLMYDRLVNYHGLHNLIWVWNGQDPDWYPGDEYVDMIGEDIYPGNQVYGSQIIKYSEAEAYTEKEMPIVLSENGCLADPDLCIRDRARWTWFCVWSGDFVKEEYNETYMWDKVYNHEYVITLDELPDLTTYGQ